MKQIHFFVSGRVQGVFYRSSTRDKARELGLAGFVRNLADGRVEVVAEGEENRISQLLTYCRNNPGSSFVENIEIAEEKELAAPEHDDFRVKY